jgi:hypothetical protein
VKRENVKVEVTDGHLAISGERKSETEEKKENFYRSEREYGSFYRLVPLPEGARACRNAGWRVTDAIACAPGTPGSWSLKPWSPPRAAITSARSSPPHLCHSHEWFLAAFRSPKRLAKNPAPYCEFFRDPRHQPRAVVLV